MWTKIIVPEVPYLRYDVLSEKLQTDVITLLDLRLSQRWLWRVLPSRKQRRIVQQKPTNAWEEPTTSASTVRQSAFGRSLVWLTRWLCRRSQQSGRPLLAGLWHGLLFEGEDGGNMFLRSVGGLLPDYIVIHSRTVVFNFFVRVPPDIISLQLCTPKVIGV
jgi:hypothetical protein